MVGQGYTEPVVLVKKRDLDNLLKAYNLIVEECQANIVVCGKCGNWHIDSYKCPVCHNDPDDPNYPSKDVKPIVMILDTNYKTDKNG